MNELAYNKYVKSLLNKLKKGEYTVPHSHLRAKVEVVFFASGKYTITKYTDTEVLCKIVGVNSKMLRKP